MREVNQEDIVHKTFNYDIFNFQVGNRKINPINYKKLTESVKEQQLRIPIIVNEKMEIIDGQHRFHAWKEQKKPIFYIVNRGYGLQETKRANIVSANWNSNDFLNTFVAEGSKNYIVFRKFMIRYNVSVNDLLYIVSKHQERNFKVLRKEFTLGNLTLEGFDEVKVFLDRFELFDKLSFSRQSTFIKAFTKIYQQEKYDHDRMIRQYHSHGHKMKKLGNLDDNICMILNDVYNFGSPKGRIGYDKLTQKFYSH